MRILIIDDDDNKSRELVSFLREKAPATEINAARSLQSGVRGLIEGAYDLVLLDMTMPTFDRTERESGGRVRPYAGLEVLRELSRRQIAAKVIVVTAFESFGEGSSRTTLQELTMQLHREYRDSVVGVVFYDPANSAWQSQFESLLVEARGQS